MLTYHISSKVFKHITVMNYFTFPNFPRGKQRHGSCPILQMKYLVTNWPLSKCLQDLLKHVSGTPSSGLPQCARRWAASVTTPRPTPLLWHHSLLWRLSRHCDWHPQECVHVLPNIRQSSHCNFFLYCIKKMFILYWSWVD